MKTSKRVTVINAELHSSGYCCNTTSPYKPALTLQNFKMHLSFFFLAVREFGHKAQVCLKIDRVERRTIAITMVLASAPRRNDILGHGTLNMIGVTIGPRPN